MVDVRREEAPGRPAEAEEEARRWPAFIAVLCKVISFSEGWMSSGGRCAATGDKAGGGVFGATAAWEGGER